MPNREHRKFGIEIECYNIQTMPEIINRLGWIIGHDGSIRGSNAYEIKSPPLPATAESFRQVKQVMRAIREAGGRVNRTCGMHVHVGVENDVRGKCVPGLFFTNLLERYYMLEGFTDMLVPASRRRNTNGYCASLSHFFGDHQNLVEARRQLRNIVDPLVSHSRNEYDYYDRMPESIIGRFGRQYKLNISAYVRHGTVEFRQFGGTLNGTKAVAWIKFCLAFVNVCSNASLRDETQRRVYTREQWENPLLGIVSRTTRTRLRSRHDANIAQTSV